MRPLSRKKLNYLIDDEKKASAEYKKLGFNCLANDEAKHRRFLIQVRKDYKQLNPGAKT
jgi:hypothetical protein